MDYVDVEDARAQPGLKLVLTAGVPGPWGEAAKGILAHKGLDYLPVRQDAGQANDALRAWTGQDSAPVLVGDSLPPASHWLDILQHAERLAPQAPLLPREPGLRAQAIGLCALIAGVNGFGWQRRLLLLAPGMQLDEPPAAVARMAAKYGWSAAAAEAALAELQAISAHLDAVLAQAEEENRAYFVGNALGAADIYWATFATMIDPLPEDVCPMPPFMRTTYSSGGEAIGALMTPRLRAHRDRIYQRHLGLPLDF
ncbi:glutathione S-transferase family protein [Parahaliea mediterranea]|uniref:glutathione S-transferase family protein n=1 Tax=Parahaliea mediterranea TaxID=651086 RepID=UPI000E2E94FB|nr:glutathione S-transferase family protein [Parahaliea mediterranea]